MPIKVGYNKVSQKAQFSSAQQMCLQFSGRVHLAALRISLSHTHTITLEPALYILSPGQIILLQSYSSVISSCLAFAFKETSSSSEFFSTQPINQIGRTP